MDQNILYIGIELDQESKNLLREKFGDQNEEWKIYCHHMTCIFNNGKDTELTEYEEKWLEKNKNVPIFLIVSHYGESEKVAAVRVMSNAPCRNKYPHVTLGVNTKNGGKPYDSNKITNWTLTEPLILVGYVKYWTKRK